MPRRISSGLTPMLLASRLAKEWIGDTFDPASASAEKVKVLTDFEGYWAGGW